MKLIVVESPTKARTLGRFLGKDYQIDSTMGHIRDLPKNKLAVDIENNFEPQYVVVSKKRDAIKKIKEDAKEADRVFLATDPDREGEAIAYHVAELLKLDVRSGKLDSEVRSEKKSHIPPQIPASHVQHPTSVARIVFHEITENAVKRALEAPGSINMQLVDAQQARRVLDRLVGYKLSPLLWKKIRRGLSAGRVQSVAVRLIVEREREIEAFRPEEYWEILAELESKNQTSKIKNFIAKLIEKDGEKLKISNGEQAGKIVGDLEKASYSVADVEKKEVVRRPSPPFTTSTMTQSAARSYFWSAKKTMSVAQRLYEEGLITYHRTDSTNLAKEAVLRARKFIEGEYGKDYVPGKPRFYKTKSKVAQEAHEAIRPTTVGRISNFQFPISNGFGNDAKKLYELIWRRFVACQMEDARFDETTISVKATTNHQPPITNHYLLQARGQVMRFEGYRRVWGAREDGDTQLPDVKKGEELDLIKIDPQQKFTEPPPRYSEALLVKTLEKLGIGRPSTYAPTISTIQDRQYVEKIEGRFHPTPLGVSVNDFLLKHFPDVFDYKFTAHMEDDLDEIANGERKWVPVMREFWQPFSKKLEGVEEKAERVKIETEKTGEKCPKCVQQGLPAGRQGEQVIRVGRFGKFLSCSRFPDCDWTGSYTEKLPMKCPECAKSLPAGRQGDVIIKKTRKGKRFYGCSRYPDCKWASWRKPKTGS